MCIRDSYIFTMNLCLDKIVFALWHRLTKFTPWGIHDFSMTVTIDPLFRWWGYNLFSCLNHSVFRWWTWPCVAVWIRWYLLDVSSTNKHSAVCDEFNTTSDIMSSDWMTSRFDTSRAVCFLDEFAQTLHTFSDPSNKKTMISFWAVLRQLRESSGFSGLYASFHDVHFKLWSLKFVYGTFSWGKVCSFSYLMSEINRKSQCK